jgi:hypothetical protein
MAGNESHDRTPEWGTMYDACMKTRNYTGAIALCQEFVNQNPKDWISWSYLGDFHRASGNQIGAIKVLELGLLDCQEQQLYSDLAY